MNTGQQVPKATPTGPVLPSIAEAHSYVQHNFQKQQVASPLGNIAVYRREVPGTVPLVLLHGIYFDHHLWDLVAAALPGRSILLMDMPLHGASQPITHSRWDLEDCASMLMAVLDELGYSQVYAGGHSWGSMTLLRAAVRHPERFKALGLCNMPVARINFAARMLIKLRHSMLPFRGFYQRKTAQALFSKKFLAADPQHEDLLSRPISGLSNRGIRRTDRAVLLQAKDAAPLLCRLQVPAFALKGAQDYVASPQSLPCETVEGGHASPLEAPEATLKLLQQVLAVT